MTKEEVKKLKVGDKVIYSDLDKGIDCDVAEVHPWQEHNKSTEYVWITKYVIPIHYSYLLRTNKSNK